MMTWGIYRRAERWERFKLFVSLPLFVFWFVWFCIIRRRKHE